MATPPSAAAATQDHARGVTVAQPQGCMHLRNETNAFILELKL